VFNKIQQMLRAVYPELPRCAQDRSRKSERAQHNKFPFSAACQARTVGRDPRRLVRPGSEQPPQNQELAEMVRVVIGKQQSLAQDGVAGAMRYSGMEVDLRV
jgi:hypothetical protein